MTKNFPINPGTPWLLATRYVGAVSLRAERRRLLPTNRVDFGPCVGRARSRRRPCPFSAVHLAGPGTDCTAARCRCGVCDATAGL